MDFLSWLLPMKNYKQFLKIPFLNKLPKLSRGLKMPLHGLFAQGKLYDIS